MKNFILVFVFLAAVNLAVPAVYHHFYFQTQAGQTVTDNSSPADPFVQDSSTANDGKYVLYNLETNELEYMDLVDFLVGSAACEMPASYEKEAIKAQMIACHSYYLYCKENGVPHDDLNLSFDKRNMSKWADKERLQQFWGVGFADNYQKFLSCAEEVKDFIVTYDGKAALTPYYAVSCGVTQSSADEWGAHLPYLTNVKSEDDVLSDSYLKVRTFTIQQMYDRLMTGFAGFELDIEHPEEWFGEISCNNAGYVDTVQVKNVKITGRDFRRYMELNSSCFMIFLEDDIFSVATKGYGHGVGLSQFGANQLSQQGKSCSEILQHYFPGTNLDKI